MAALFFFLLVAFLPLFPLPLHASTQHIVGDAAGWTIPAIGNLNYSTWADSNTFYVGDTLLFQYEADLHNVVEVTANDFESCTVTTSQASFDDGSTIILLNKTSTWYFICGFPGHCSTGQKVAVQVLIAPPAPPPSMVFAPAPAPIVDTSMSPVSAPIVSPSSHSTMPSPSPSIANSSPAFVSSPAASPLANSHPASKPPSPQPTSGSGLIHPAFQTTVVILTWALISASSWLRV